MESTKWYSFFGIDGIGGGLVSENPIILGKNQMIIADNLLVGTVVSRKKRGGQTNYSACYASMTSYVASGIPIRGIVDFWRTASLAGNPIDNLCNFIANSKASLYIGISLCFTVAPSR